MLVGIWHQLLHRWQNEGHDDLFLVGLRQVRTEICTQIYHVNTLAFRYSLNKFVRAYQRMNVSTVAMVQLATKGYIIRVYLALKDEDVHATTITNTASLNARGSCFFPYRMICLPILKRIRNTFVFQYICQCIRQNIWWYIYTNALCENEWHSILHVIITGT